MTLTYGSLFSGIGGFDRAGMECAWQVEYDAKARSVLERHWPDVQRFEDVRNVGQDNLRPVDVICGGFPCQDVSLAGKRAGLAGKRSGLWSEFSRIIGELTPAWVVIENVPGLLSSNRGADMGTVLWELADLGYGWAYRVLDAQYFGVAQRRRRVFIVGHLGTNGERAGTVLFEPDSLPWHPAPRRGTREGVAGSLAPGAHANGFNDRDADRGMLVTGTLIAPTTANPIGSHHGRNDLDNDTCVVEPVSFDWQLAGSERSTVVDRPGQTRSLSASKSLAVLAAPQVARQAKGAFTDPVNDNIIVDPFVFETRYARNGRGAPDTVVPPLKAESGKTGKGDSAPVVIAFAQNTRDEVRQIGGDGQISGALAAQPGMKQQTYVAYNIQHNDGGQHRRQDRPNGGLYVSETDTALTVGTTDLTAIVTTGARRLTPIECERLQGFPDGWTDGQSDSARYRQLGNAVAVPVAEWIGRRIMEVR